MKSELRRAALQRRAAVPQDVREAFAARAAHEGLVLARQNGSAVAAAYWPIRGEADPLPLLAALGGANIPTALPAVAGRGKPLIFRAWRSGDPLADGPFSLREPVPGSPALDPDLLFVP